MRNLFLFLFLLSSLVFCSCSSSRQLSSKKNNPEHLSRKLGFPVSSKDDLSLYREAANWLGVPYKYGGNTKSGVDCSGLVCQIYRTVYHIQLQRTAAGMYKENCRKISRKALRPGDLVFFNTAKTKKSVSHVGIFLKNNVFLHATTKSGVRLSTLDEIYYKKRWINGGKVKK